MEIEEEVSSNQITQQLKLQHQIIFTLIIRNNKEVQKLKKEIDNQNLEIVQLKSKYQNAQQAWNRV